jgi:sugar/nucleoside kinase (ribokinase family)
VTGAGDAFLAGLVAAELAGADPAGMVRAGVDAAAAALGSPGGRPPA